MNIERESPKLLFDEAEHKYTLRRAGLADIVLPSVTQVMEPLERKVYGDISSFTLDNAADRGTRVHRAAEQYLKYGFRNVDEDCAGYFDGFMEFLEDHLSWEPIHSEYRFYHKALLYAGTADLLMKTPKGIVLIDFKTTAQAHTRLWGVQLAAYWQGIQNYSGSIDIQRALVVQLSGDGRYVLHEIKPNMPLFLSCLQIYNFRED